MNMEDVQDENEEEELAFNMDLAMAVVAKNKKKKQHRRNKPMTKKKKETKNQALRDLLQGAVVYGLCITLPTMLGVVVKLYQVVLVQPQEDDDDSSRVSFYYRAFCNYLCQEWNCWCQREATLPVVEALLSGTNNTTQTSSYNVEMDTSSAISDMMLVTILSTSMAMFRILLVHLLVPKYLETPQRLEALVRSKSTHLLSSSYQLTPKSPEKDVLLETAASGAPPLPLDIGEKNHSNVTEETKPLLLPKDQQEPEPLETEDDNKDWIQKTKDMLHSGKRSASRSSLLALGHEPTDEILDAANDPDEHDNNNNNKSHATQERKEHVVDKKDDSRLFAAPRYATAVFRLGYSITACAVALRWFRNASFWPIYVLGNPGQSTRHCWDLKGGFGGEAAEDFDDLDFWLKRFFILQASYHLHSLCFHILSLIVLLLVMARQKKQQQQEQSLLLPTAVKRGFSRSSYLTALAQHAVAIVCLVGCYFFSSLRRLGAVGMFCLDCSSVFLHFLQVCINAPLNHKLSNKRFVRLVHVGLVIPSYLYTRFFVLPFVVWYSALVESKDWLLQVEQTLFVGCAFYVKTWFWFLLVLVTVLHLIRLRRLLFHPHLTRILREEETM